MDLWFEVAITVGLFILIIELWGLQDAIDSIGQQLGSIKNAIRDHVRWLDVQK